MGLKEVVMYWDYVEEWVERWFKEWWEVRLFVMFVGLLLSFLFGLLGLGLVGLVMF